LIAKTDLYNQPGYIFRLGKSFANLKDENRMACKFRQRTFTLRNGGTDNCKAAIYVDKEFKYFWSSSNTHHFCGTLLEAFRKKREEDDSNH
jgi:hypothetical protein